MENKLNHKVQDLESKHLSSNNDIMASHFSYLSVDRKAYVEYAEESEEDTADPPFDVVLESY